MGVTPKLDETKLTPEQREKLEAYHHNQKQLETLGDIADMTQEVINILDDKTSDKKVENLGVLLTDIRETLSALNDKEAPEAPDYAQPVVEAVSKLEKALSASIKAIDVKPQVNIDAPKVNVQPPDVDLKGVEKAVGALPKAFEQAIKLIPRVEIPEQDFTPLIDKLEDLSEQLASIDTATRMKPEMGSVTVSNLNDVTTQLEQSNIKYEAFQFDPNDDAPIYIGQNIDSDASDNDASWVIYKFTYSGANVTSLKKKIGSWTDRSSLFA